MECGVAQGDGHAAEAERAEARGRRGLPAAGRHVPERAARLPLQPLSPGESESESRSRSG